MDAADFEFIERHLDLILPDIFRKFMDKRPNDRTLEVHNDVAVVPCNAEMFVIYQLKASFGSNIYELQPDLVSRRFMEVGGDGCGNYFFMAGDDAQSDEIWIWEHDPYDGLSLVEDYTLTEHFLSNENWEMVAQPNPFDAVYGTYILRADHPMRSIMNQIPMDEWLRYVERHDLLVVDEDHIGENPFTGEKVAFKRWPGRAKVRCNDQDCYISYDHGALSLGSDVSSHLESVATQIASDLNSHIWTGR